MRTMVLIACLLFANSAHADEVPCRTTRGVDRHAPRIVVQRLAEVVPGYRLVSRSDCGMTLMWLALPAGMDETTRRPPADMLVVFDRKTSRVAIHRGE